MSKDYKGIYREIIELRNDLIYELGVCYLNNRPCESILRSFFKNLDFIIYPNRVFTDDGIPIIESKYDVNGDKLLPDIEV